MAYGLLYQKYKGNLFMKKLLLHLTAALCVVTIHLSNAFAGPGSGTGDGGRGMLPVSNNSNTSNMYERIMHKFNGGVLPHHVFKGIAKLAEGYVPFTVKFYDTNGESISSMSMLWNQIDFRSKKEGLEDLKILYSIIDYKTSTLSYPRSQTREVKILNNKFIITDLYNRVWELRATKDNYLLGIYYPNENGKCQLDGLNPSYETEPVDGVCAVLQAWVGFN